MRTRPCAALVFGLAIALLATGCIVDTPPIENTQTTINTAGPSEPTAVPQFDPTVPPSPPTPSIPSPTPVPPTVEAEPTATSAPAPVDGPTPLPASGSNTDFAPSVVEAGLVAVPVASATFVLDQARPVLQLAGHTLIYLDDAQLAEVDIFTPVANKDAVIFESYDDVIDYLITDPLFGDIEELASVTIAGLDTRVFEATTEIEAAQAPRAFITDEAVIKDAVLGWYPPKRFEVWVIDHPEGPVIVSAESLEDPGQYIEAVAFATDILSTITFG